MNRTANIKYNFIDTETGSTIKLTKLEARELNNSAQSKRYRQIVDNMVKTIDDNGNVELIKASEYDKNVHTHFNKNQVRVQEIATGEWKFISRDQFDSNRQLYTTPTSGLVNAININTGEVKQITTEEYQTNSHLYAGHTKGLTTAKDLTTGQFVQIPKTWISMYPERYVGGNKGKVNMINIKTGERKQMLKQDITPDYITVSNSKYLFPCTHVKTQKSKLIHIAEWDIVKDNYIITDQTRFDLAQQRFKLLTQ